MIYSLDSPYMPHLIDEYKTGYTEEDEGLECSVCGAEIISGSSYYDVCGKIYCPLCSDAAESHILDNVRNNYIFEY